MKRLSACAAVLGLMTVVLTSTTLARRSVREVASAQPDLLARARALHRQVPLIDGHNDFPSALRAIDPARDLTTADLSRPATRFMTDIPRLRAGGLGGQFWSLYIPSTLPDAEVLGATLTQIDLVHRMIATWPETFQLARSAADVERVFASGRIASLIGMEGGRSIDGSLAVLRMMRALGAGYLTLVHVRNLPWADSGTDTPALGGLSSFGEEVVRELNRLGMLVDLSHASPDTMADAIRVSAAPVIFSHSSIKAICNSPRNVPDDILRLLPANGGVVMLTFAADLVSQEVADYGAQLGAQTTTLRARFGGDEAGLKAALDAWRAAHPEPKATLAQVADHIDHARKVAGIDHIGIGADFDGITSVVAGLEDVSTYPALTAELLRRGYADDEVKKVLGMNILRVMRAAERGRGQTP